MSISRFVLFVVLVPLIACDTQVDGDDQGTVLATLGGTVSSTRAQPTDADVVVVWRNRRSPGMHRGAVIPVEGTFPAEFTLSIYEPPPEDLMNSFDQTDSPLGTYYGCAADIDPDAACETKFGVAYLFAALPGQTDFTWPAPQALGMDPDHLLVYVPADVPAGSLASKLLHSAPTAGFHVFGVRRLTSAQHAERTACFDTLTENGTREPLLQELYDQCGGLLEVDDLVPLPGDLMTLLGVKLVDDLSTIDQPIW